MNEIRNTLLTEASELLGQLIPTLQRSIDSLQQDLNPDEVLLQHLLQQEIANQEGLLQWAEEMVGNIQDFLNPEPDYPQDDHLRRGPLHVTMENDEQIHLRFGSRTFVEVIERIGIERIKTLGLTSGGIDLIATYNYPGRQQTKSGDYYIMVNNSTTDKRELLEKIALFLDVELSVEEILD